MPLTTANEDDEVEEFYDELESTIIVTSTIYMVVMVTSVPNLGAEEKRGKVN